MGLSSDAELPEITLDWLLSLARLAFCSTASGDTDTPSSTGSSNRFTAEDFIWQKREWALGALLHVVKATSKTLGKDLRRQMARLGGTCEELEGGEEVPLSVDLMPAVVPVTVCDSSTSTNPAAITV